jgi:hypothetical protein
MPEETNLAPYEPAARIYCKRVGLDPDLMIAVPHPLGLQVSHSVPQWYFVAEDLIDLSHKLGAMREAKETGVVGTGH